MEPERESKGLSSILYHGSKKAKTVGLFLHRIVCSSTIGRTEHVVSLFTGPDPAVDWLNALEMTLPISWDLCK